MAPETFPKKILYVENGIGYGGAVICLRHLVRNLDHSRYIPYVVTNRDEPPYREIATEAEWIHLKDHYFDPRKTLEWVHAHVHPGAGQLVARLDDLVNRLPYLLRMLNLARRIRPDLIHTNNEPLCNIAALLSGRLLGIPTIAHVRGDLQGSYLMHRAYRLPDHFVPVSQWIAQSMRRTLGIPQERISVVYDGLELERLDPETDGRPFRHRFGIADDDFAVGLVALLIPWKGQDIFIDAAERLRHRIPRLKMMIVGAAPQSCRDYERQLKARVCQEGLEDTVIFTGHVADMPAVYNGLDVVVNASTSPDPLGTVVIEAMAMARPLIGPDHGGAAEMIDHEHTGLLFAPGDPEALTEAIERFHDDIELRERCRHSARRHALKTFAVTAHATAVQQVYDYLLNLVSTHA
ncbi:hypothetical protein MIN45_P2075 [Methylomarinovum tepidoasis]|uniref:Glycosyltransferase family 1 protein n=1 Tax=Methylomarinovum tepidoasis TaxID=2840183 RepID=A0AAU9CCK0_9GAMM|nr:glycosyltransferase family 4 protein [Methylomarinovum sp. IN45]BCX89702.1 hypothetical protein MIN45_P2075 [Methylomarinovum sp. IN45]